MSANRTDVSERDLLAGRTNSECEQSGYAGEGLVRRKVTHSEGEQNGCARERPALRTDQQRRARTSGRAEFDRMRQKALPGCDHKRQPGWAKMLA